MTEVLLIDVTVSIVPVISLVKVVVWVAEVTVTEESVIDVTVMEVSVVAVVAVD